MALIVNNTTITNLNVVQRATGATTNINVLNESGGKVIFTKHFTLTKSSGAVVTRVGTSLASNTVYLGALENGATINYGDILEITPATIIDNVGYFGYFVINGTVYGSSTNRSVRITVTSNINVVAYYWSEVFTSSSNTEFSASSNKTSYTTKVFNDWFTENRGVNFNSLFNASYTKLRLYVYDKAAKDDADTDVSSYTFNKPTLTSSQQITVLGMLAGLEQYITVTGVQYGTLIVPQITLQIRGKSMLVPDGIYIRGAQQLIY